VEPPESVTELTLGVVLGNVTATTTVSPAVVFIVKLSPDEFEPVLWACTNPIPVALLTPVPVRLTVCGLLLASSFTVTVPLRVPVVVGLKLTLMVQLAPGARLFPQLLLSRKLVLAEIPLIFKVPLPVLVSVTGCGPLVEFTC